MNKLKLIQSDKWPYSYTITDATDCNGVSVGIINVNIMLAVLHSKDTLKEANARPENIMLSKYLKLFAASPEMLVLLEESVKIADADADDVGYWFQRHQNFMRNINGSV